MACPFGLALWFVVPAAEGVAANAWQLLALFMATNAAIIGKAMPIGALSMPAVLIRLLWAGVPALLFGGARTPDRTASAFIGLCALLLSGLLDREDVLKEKSAWDTIVWFSALVMMATCLKARRRCRSRS